MDAHNSMISHMAEARSAELRREAEARGLARIARKRSRRAAAEAARDRFGAWSDRRRRAPRSAPAVPVLHPDAAPGPVDADVDVDIAADEGLRQTA
jgi:hypothetical protein